MNIFARLTLISVSLKFVFTFEVDPSILVGRGLAPAGEDPDKNLPCVKSVTSAKHDGGIVLSAGASPRPTTDHFALS